MIKGIFITGTDTGVGKTYVAALLAKEFNERGIDVGVMKPAETGCRKRKGQLYPADAARLMKAAHVFDQLDDVCPYRFSQPLAPSVAASLENKLIVPEKIVKRFQALSKNHEIMIVEGAGGIMVPLQNRYTYLDLASDLGLPVLVVARPALGTINHTLLTIAALQRRRLPIAGVVINFAKKGKTGPAEKTAPAVIEKLSGVPILAIVGHASDKGKHLADAILPG